MQRRLGMKQSSNNDDWLDVYYHIEDYVSKEEVKEAAERTINEIKRTTFNYHNPIFAYSGGKDSIVLADLCDKADIHVGVMSITEMEYPAFNKWLEVNCPNGVHLVSTKQNLDWLAKHQDRFLPRKEDVDKQSPINIGVQHDFYDKYGADVILLGRRKADGNYVGRGGNFYTDSTGRNKYNPISEWPHELLLGYIRYYGLNMPPIYDWADGFIQGTHPWFYREIQKGATFESTLQEIVKIDPNILKQAAKKVPIIAKAIN